MGAAAGPPSAASTLTTTAVATAVAFGLSACTDAATATGRLSDRLHSAGANVRHMGLLRSMLRPLALAPVVAESEAAIAALRTALLVCTVLPYCVHTVTCMLFRGSSACWCICSRSACELFPHQAIAAPQVDMVSRVLKNLLRALMRGESEVGWQTAPMLSVCTLW